MAPPVLPAGSKLLAEGRVGRIIKDGTTAKPDPRKGLLRVLRTEDGLVHLEWWSREEGTPAGPEFDEIVFPDEAEWVKPDKAPPRVYKLQYKEESDRDVWFWMQEPSEAADAEILSKINKAINTPMGMDLSDEGVDDLPPEQQLASDALLRGHISDVPGAGDEMIAGDSVGLMPQGPGQQPMGPAQLAALLSGMAGRGAPQAGSGGGPQDPGASLAAALLAAMARQQQQRDMVAMARAPGPGLSEVLKPEVLAPLLQDPEVLERLSTYLPEEQRSREALVALAHSPQFHQQLATFGGALQTGQLDLAQFGLQAEGFRVADFLKAIEDLVEREKAQEQQQGGEQS